jgi:hypothetical protein
MPDIVPECAGTMGADFVQSATSELVAHVSFSEWATTRERF